MKKITLLLLTFFLSFVGYSQGLTENFDGGTSLPNGWVAFNNGQGTAPRLWRIFPATSAVPSFSAPNSAFSERYQIGQGNTSQDWLATAAVQLPANAQLQFVTRQRSDGDQGTLYRVMVARVSAGAQNNPAIYQQAQQWTELTLNPEGPFNADGSARWDEHTVDLRALGYNANEQVYIAFVRVFTQPNTGNTADVGWHIDDVRVSEKCAIPTQMAAPVINMTSAQLSWVTPAGGATTWEVVIVPETLTLEQGIAAGNIYTYSGAMPFNTATYSPTITLNPDTNYKYYVRAVCSPTNKSDWTLPYFFTTASLGETCTEPIVIPQLPYQITDNTNNSNDRTDVSQGTSCGATPAGTNFMAGNEVFYTFTAPETGEVRIRMTPTAPNSSLFVYNSCANVGVSCIAGVANTGSGVRTIPALAVTAGQTYIVVISSAAANQTVGYTLNIQYVTCDEPTNLAATANMTTAFLSWNNPAGNTATTWQIAVQPAGAPIPSGAGTNVASNNQLPVTTTIDGTPITAATAYQYWVRVPCVDGGTTYSPWAGPFLFNTPVCNPSEQCNYTFRLTRPSGNGGYSGAIMHVRQNGVTVAILGPGFTSGTASAVSVPLCNGIPFELFWIEGGTSAAAIGITVQNSFNQLLYTKTPGTGSPSADTPLYSKLVDCITPMCPAPIALASNTITANSANLTWTPGSLPAPAGVTTQWQIYVEREAVAVAPLNTAPTSAYPVITTRPYPATGLISDTWYVFYVRTYCGDGWSSEWSGPHRFRTAVSCGAPTALGASGQTTTSANLFWTQPALGGATSWEVVVQAPGTGAPGLTPANAQSLANGGTYSGLTAATQYEYYVRANCSATDNSSWSGPFVFYTACNPVNVPYTEGFNTTSVYEPCWSVVSILGANTWDMNYNLTPSEGDQVASILPNSGTQNDDWLISPALRLLSNYRLRFKYKVLASAANNNNIEIKLSTTGSAPASFTETLMPVTTWSNTTYQEKVINLNNFGNNDGSVLVHIGWHLPQGVNNSTRIFIDEVILEPIPACPNPTDLSVGNVTSTSADLTWGQGFQETQWQVYVQPAGGTVPPAGFTGTPVTDNTALTVSTNFAGQPLQPGTNYEYYVRAYCSATQQSQWVGPITFKTLLCEVADKCTYTFILQDTGNNAWGSSMNVIQNGEIVAVLNKTTTTGASVTQAVALCPGVQFQVFWNLAGTAAQAAQVGLTIQNSTGETIYTKVAGQGVQNTTLYNSMPVYCTPLSCPFPTLLTAQQTSPTTASLSWTPGGTETQWQYVLQLAGGTYPGNTNGTVVNTNPSVNVTGLISAQPYEYYVRAICGAGDVSYWSGPYTFTLYNSPGCVGVDIAGVAVSVGEEITVCPNDGCVDLSASYFQIKETTTYTVESIPYLPPFPFTGGTPIPIGTDDDWTDTVTLPFNFCFFGETYNKLLVTDNGAISFSIAGVVPGGRYTPLGPAGYSYTQPIPYNPSEIRPPYVNAIMGVMQDLYPGGSTGDWSINYQVLGTAPCRAFVVNFYNVSQFSCTTQRENSQIVIYEGSNIIDVYIGNHSICSFNSGSATVGIQNANGTVGFAPPGRNTGQWTTTNEAWRFNPAGNNLNVDFKWMKGTEFYSNDLDISVCVEDVTLMTAVATYPQCGAPPVVRQSEVTIVPEPFDTQEPTDLAECAGNATFDLTENNANILDGTVTPADYVIEYYLTEAEAESGTTGAITSHTTSATTPIFVRIEKVGTDCYIIETFNLLLSAAAPDFTVTGNTTICEGDDTTITVVPTNFDVADATYTWTAPDGTVSTQTGSTFNIAAADAQEGTYTVVANNGCTGTQTFTLTINQIELGFTYPTPICPSGVINPTLNADFTTGGAFSVSPTLTIDATTGTINLDGAAAGTYTVTYLLPASVSGCTLDKTNTFEFVVLPAVVPVTTFTYTNAQYCITDPSPIAINPGTGFQTGGVFTSIPDTGLGLDPATGSIDFASTTPGVYTVYYTIASDATNCTAFSQDNFEITINAAGVPVTGFSYTTPVCVSGTNPTPIPVTGFVTGGTYTVISGSGLALNGSTGEIDLASSAAGTFVIRYEVPASGCGQLGQTDATIVINSLAPAVVGFSYNSVCQNATTNPTPVKVAGFAEGGTWSSTDAGVVVDATTGAINLSQSVAGVYTIQYNINQNDATCTAAGTQSAQITINAGVNPNTVFNYADNSYCAGAAPVFPQGTFDAGGTFTAPSGLVINSVTGELDIAGSAPGVYEVKYIIEADAATCRNRSETSFTITIEDGLEVTVTDECQNNNYILTASPSSGSYTYIWRNAQGDQVGSDYTFNVSQYINSMSSQPTYPMNFTVTVVNAGCESTEIFAVTGTFCTIQKGISPNNDGKNDTFDLTGFNVKKLTIYNRYGKEVYSFSNYTNEWRGQSDNGNDLPDGTYYYVIERDGVEGKSGWIQINRQRN